MKILFLVGMFVHLVLIHANLFFTDKRTDVVLNPEVGGRVKLNCRTGGDPKVSIEWELPNGSTPQKRDKKFRFKKYVLIVNNMRAEDSGIYKCVAIGPNESITKNFFITVGDAEWTTPAPATTPHSITNENNTRMIQELYNRVDELSSLVHRLEREGRGVHIHINDGAGHNHTTKGHHHNNTGGHNESRWEHHEGEGPRPYYSNHDSERLLPRGKRDAEFADDGTFSHSHRDHHMRYDSAGRPIESDGEELTHHHGDHHRPINNENTENERDFSHSHREHHVRYDAAGRPMESDGEEHTHPHGDHHRLHTGSEHHGRNSSQRWHMEDAHDHHDNHRHYSNAEHVYVDLNLKARLQNCDRGGHQDHHDHHDHMDHDEHQRHEESHERHHEGGMLVGHCQMFPNGLMVNDNGDANGVTGYVHMTQERYDDPISLHFMLTGGPANTNTGFHLHTLGDVSRGCESLGSHYNPHNRRHGNIDDEERHMGDMGNIYFDDEGKAKENLSVRAGCLKDLYGRSIVVHRFADEFTDDRTGGQRIACCVVGRAEQGMTD